MKYRLPGPKCKNMTSPRYQHVRIPEYNPAFDELQAKNSVLIFLLRAGF